MTSFNIALKELRVNLKSLIKWLIFLVLVIFVSSLLFEFLFKDNADMNNYLELLPPIVLAFVNMDLAIDYSTAPGFLSFIFVFPTYMLVFAAAFTGTRLLTREREAQSFEFLYSRPIHRNQILFAKLLAGLIFCIITNLAVTLPLRHFFGEYGIGSLIITYAQANLLLQVLALSGGALIAFFCRYADSAAQYSGLIILVTIVLERVLAIAGGGGILWVLTPFSYFPPLELIAGDGLSATALLLTLVLTTFFITLLTVLHLRRDFHLSR